MGAPPRGSGTLTVSRGRLNMATCPVTGSMLATIIVSVLWSLIAAPSEPTRRMC
jgi:hypothetical protein